MKSLGLKAVALFLAIGVWFAVSAPRREKPFEQTFAAPLSLAGMKPQYVITTPVPDKVSIRVRGRRSDLRTLSSQSLEVPVDLGWVEREGTATITLYPQAVNVPTDVEVVSVEPNKFRFTVERVRQRTLPIRALLVGDVAPGYLAGTPVLSPDRALVSGPASQVMAMNELGTERIIMSGRTEAFTQRVAIVSDSQLVRVVDPLMTTATVPVYAPVGPNQPPPATDTIMTSTEQPTTTTITATTTTTQ